MSPEQGDAVVVAAKSSDLLDGGRLVVSIGSIEVGLFRIGEDLVAYENRCPHQGGPVCQGKILPNVVEILDEERKSRGHRWDEERPQISCPWHGYEFDLRTGIYPTNPRVRMRPVKAWETDGVIYVDITRLTAREAR